MSSHKLALEWKKEEQEQSEKQSESEGSHPRLALKILDHREKNL